MGDLSFEEWMSVGIRAGWCGAPVCYTHDGLPTSHAEDEEWEQGDPCIHIVRMYESPEVKEAVEQAHAPSNWRNKYI
jgi:hypothetical protein